MPLLLLQPDAKPFVLLNRAYAPLPWNTGLFLKVRLRASHMILTSGAVTYFRNDQLNDLAASGWSSLGCEQSDDSLCLHPPLLDLFNARTVQEPYLYPDGLREQYPFVSDVCAKRSGRHIVNGSLYTVSMCDLIDSRAQFVLVEHPDTRRVFFKADSTALVQYACLACVCLYAVATLARHAVLLVKVAQAGEPADTETKTNAASHILQFIPGALKKYMRVPVLHVGLSLYLVAEVLAGLPSIATQSETWLALYLAAYVVWDCVFCVWTLYFETKETLQQINVMVVLLMMSCLRLYHSFQNVFHGLFVVMFAIRTWCKVVLAMLINANPATSAQAVYSCNVSIAYDVLTLYLLLLCQNRSTESAFDSQLMNSNVLLIGIPLGAAVACIHKANCR
jgi:hypothetical protein